MSLPGVSGSVWQKGRQGEKVVVSNQVVGWIPKDFKQDPPRGTRVLDLSEIGRFPAWLELAAYWSQLSQLHVLVVPWAQVAAIPTAFWASLYQLRRLRCTSVQRVHLEEVAQKVAGWLALGQFCSVELTGFQAEFASYFPEHPPYQRVVGQNSVEYVAPGAQPLELAVPPHEGV